MKPAIQVQNLGKCYRVDHAAQRGRYKTLRESLTHLASAPLRRLRGGDDAEHEDFWALKDVSFDVRPGEVVGIIGRNGAGKSTLLKILSRITKPTSGEVNIRGRVGSLLEVGTGFHPELTGRENIYLNGSILGMARRQIDSKFDEIVNFSGVEKFLDTPVKRYSSGMYVRLAFSVAAHLEPEVLVVDEVLSVGDAEFQRKCLGKMADVARSGRTILFVSHNLAAIGRLCTRGVFVERGAVGFDGTPADAIRCYAEETSRLAAHGRYLASESPPEPTRGMRILRAEVTSNGEYSGDGYATGKPLEFRVLCASGGEAHWPALGIGIDTVYADRVVTLHSEYLRCSRNLRSVAGEFEFVCRVPSLALAPGEYRVKLSLESQDCVGEALDPALMFTVAPADFYGNGGRFGRGVVLCAQEWTVKKVNQ